MFCAANLRYLRLPLHDGNSKGTSSCRKILFGFLYFRLLQYWIIDFLREIITLVFRSWGAYCPERQFGIRHRVLWGQTFYSSSDNSDCACKRWSYAVGHSIIIANRKAKLFRKWIGLWQRSSCEWQFSFFIARKNLILLKFQIWWKKTRI